MKKIVLITVTVVILIGSLFIIYTHFPKDIQTVAESKEIIDSLETTILGGSTMKESANAQACGYVMKTKNGELIIVDGGNDIDAELVLSYIEKIGNGTVDHWFVTHPHSDHVGALLELIENENIIIENLYYSFNSLEWYQKYDDRGFATEEKMIQALESSKIKNKISCTKNQEFYIDNIQCDILRIANPEITTSDNGNDSSMVFKMTATDVNKSILFLGDAYYYSSIELLENPEKLKADVVQMSHHGQNGVSKEVYEAIHPEICMFNAPEWLYNNDSGMGYNTGFWHSIEVREWMEEMGAQNIVAFEGDRTIRFTKNGIEI